MVKLQNKWKIDPELKIEMEIDNLPKIFDVNKIKEKKSELLMNYESVYEKEARNSLLNSIVSYLKAYGEHMGDESDYLLICEVWKKIRDELNLIVNRVFDIELSGKKLRKRKGESMEHYLMRCAILIYLNEKHGVTEFYEEYSKLKEFLEDFTKSEAEEREWEKVAKRADLYVILEDGLKLWIEVERDIRRFDKKIEDKISRLKKMLSHFPDLFDKVVFVFSDLLGIFVVESILSKAKEMSFPENKIEIYEINLKENRIRHFSDLKLVKVEFGERILDMIADGIIEKILGKKGIRNARDKIKENIIKPLINREWDGKYVKSKQKKNRESY